MPMPMPCHPDRLLAAPALAALLALAGAAPPAAAAAANGPYYALPAWSQQLAPAVRFVVLTNWSNEAVLDRETGLVWELAPSTVPGSHIEAHLACNRKSVGGRKGWRLPSFQELTSLIDPAVPAPGPRLPPGHPFVNVFNVFWSATLALGSGAWGVDTGTGADNVVKWSQTVELGIWCVRGGTGAPAQ